MRLYVLLSSVVCPSYSSYARNCCFLISTLVGLSSFLINRIRYLLLARMLRLIRILTHVKRYRAFISTFLTLIPSLMPYLGTIFCVLCIYCSLGVQVMWILFLFALQMKSNQRGKWIIGAFSFVVIACLWVHAFHQ